MIEQSFGCNHNNNMFYNTNVNNVGHRNRNDNVYKNIRHENNIFENQMCTRGEKLNEITNIDNLSCCLDTNNNRNPFEFPTSLEDERWYWRNLLQNRLTQKNHIDSIVQNNYILNSHVNIDNVDKNKNEKKIGFRESNTLKFGCVQHDLIRCLKWNYGLQCPLYSFCNNHNKKCYKSQEFNQFHKIGEWNFNEIGILFENSCRSTLPLIIKFNQNYNDYNGYDNEKNEIIFIDIWRHGHGVFQKKFRPGIYNYDGEIIKNQKQQLQQLGCWNEGKAFYVLKNDKVIMLVKSDFYFQFELHSAQTEAIDHIRSIVGGVGLTMHSNGIDNHNDNQKNNIGNLTNCILLRSNQKTIKEVLLNSKMILYSKSSSSYNIFINKLKVMSLSHQNYNENSNHLNFMNQSDAYNRHLNSLNGTNVIPPDSIDVNTSNSNYNTLSSFNSFYNSNNVISTNNQPRNTESSNEQNTQNYIDSCATALFDSNQNNLEYCSKCRFGCNSFNNFEFNNAINDIYKYNDERNDYFYCNCKNSDNNVVNFNQNDINNILTINNVKSNMSCNINPNNNVNDNHINVNYSFCCDCYFCEMCNYWASSMHNIN